MGFITIKLLDENGEYKMEFSLCQWDKPLIWEFSKWEFNYTPADMAKDNHEVKKFRWVHVCGFLDMKSEMFGIYIDGAHMGNASIHNDRGGPPSGSGPVITLEDKQRFELYIGTHRTVPGDMANRIIGMVQGFNVYTYIDEAMLKNISGCKFQKEGDYVSWDNAEWINMGTNDSLIITKEVDFEVICPDKEINDSTVSLIPHPVLDYYGALDRCKSLTMQMTVPFNNGEHEKIMSGGNTKAMREHCFDGGRHRVLYAMQMSASGRFFDPQTNITTDDYALSYDGWRTTKTLEELKGNDKILYGYTGKDFNPDSSKGELAFLPYANLENAQWDASKIVCFSCISSKIPELKIRGLCPGSYFDRKISFLLDKNGFVHFYGTTKSHIGKKDTSNF